MSWLRYACAAAAAAAATLGICCCWCRCMHAFDFFANYTHRLHLRAFLRVSEPLKTKVYVFKIDAPLNKSHLLPSTNLGLLSTIIDIMYNDFLVTNDVLVFKCVKDLIIPLNCNLLVLFCPCISIFI